MAKTPRDFYKTTFTVEILSDAPIRRGLLAIAYELLEGDYEGRAEKTGEILCNGAAMADELTKFGSRPEVFGLNADGVHEDDREPIVGYWNDPDEGLCSRTVTIHSSVHSRMQGDERIVVSGLDTPDCRFVVLLQELERGGLRHPSARSKVSGDNAEE